MNVTYPRASPRRDCESRAAYALRRFDAYRFAVLRGRIYKTHESQFKPYPKGSIEAACFAYGYRPAKRYGSRAAAKGAGRGRAVVGGRGEWSQDDLALLAIIAAQAKGTVSGAEAACYFKGRSEDAVRMRRQRLAEEPAAAA